MKKCQLLFFLNLLFMFHLLFVSCLFKQTKVHQIDKNIERIIIKSPTKAHLNDGSLIFLAGGFEMTENIIIGDGLRYDILRKNYTEINLIPRDSVAYLEYYQQEYQLEPILGGILAPLSLMKSIFGSCPTVYSSKGKEHFLQAECFSYSISPYLETDDLDYINQVNVDNGQLVLNVRNEALETHYINQMKLLVVEHPEEFEAFTVNKTFLERKNQIILFGQESPILHAISKSGHKVETLLSMRDGQGYQSDLTISRQLTKEVIKDWIDVVIKVPENKRKMIMAVRFKNTLFHTMMFYDLVLAKLGAKAIDWMALTMSNLYYTTQLYNWYQNYFGIQVQLLNDNTFKQPIFIGDTGPIAWRQVAFELSVPENQMVKVRFSFLPDNINLDWIGVTFDTPSDMKIYEIKCDKIINLKDNKREINPALLNRIDDQYLVTFPSESFLLIFNISPHSRLQKQSYFINSRGFYIEWIRQNWLRSADCINEYDAFQLNETSIIMGAQKWLAKKSDFEKQFFKSKISIQ